MQPDGLHGATWSGPEANNEQQDILRKSDDGLHIKGSDGGLIESGPFAGLKQNGYQLILSDPPWSFKSWSHRGEGRSASQHYGCMSIADICALPVKDITAKDAVLFMWVVQPMLPEALEVIKAWGFTYKTVGYVWIKIKGRQDRLFYTGEDVRRGLGYHTRAGCEQCWIAVKGDGYDRLSQGEAQVVFAPLREHSRKPDEIRESIERLVGNVPRLEMFARASAKGWDVSGDEVEKFSAVV